MTAVTFSPKLRQDLLDIGDCVARDSPTNARRFVARLVDQCKRIGRAPLGYASREDLAPGLRMAALDRYVIFFRVIDGVVRVERVLHGARNLPVVTGQSLGAGVRLPAEDARSLTVIPDVPSSSVNG